MPETSLPSCELTGAFEVMGPVVEFTTGLDEGDGYCVIRSVIRPNVFVGIHSHPDHETLYILKGELEGYMDGEWETYGPGDTFDIPGDMRHAFRNVSGCNVSILLITTMGMGRFLYEIAEPEDCVPPGPPTPTRLNRFIGAAQSRGYWLGTPQENAAIGLNFPGTI